MAFHPASETPISDQGTSSQRVSGAAMTWALMSSIVPPLIGRGAAAHEPALLDTHMVDPVTGAHQKGEAAEREQRHPRPAAGDDGGGEPQPEDGEMGIALDQTERTGHEPAHVLGEIGAEQ